MNHFFMDCGNFKHLLPFMQVPQACTVKSPNEGPFKKTAPAWCYAPFEPEGILRSRLLQKSQTWRYRLYYDYEYSPFVEPIP